MTHFVSQALRPEILLSAGGGGDWTPPPDSLVPLPFSLPCGAKQGRPAYIIREVDAKVWDFWGCVLYIVAKLDSPFPFQHVGVCSEKCNTMFIVTPHLSRGIIAQSLGMQTNTEIKKTL